MRRPRTTTSSTASCAPAWGFEVAGASSDAGEASSDAGAWPTACTLDRTAAAATKPILARVIVDIGTFRCGPARWPQIVSEPTRKRRGLRRHCGEIRRAHDGFRASLHHYAALYKRP